MIKKSSLCVSIAAILFLSNCAQNSNGNIPNIILPNQEKTPTDLNDSGIPFAPQNTNHEDLANLTPQLIAGVWQAKIGDMQCQISTSRTKSGKGLRAAAMLCPPPISHAKYWNIVDNHLLFYNVSDKILADLTPTDDGSLNGQTRSHEEMKLWRQ